MTTVPTCVPFSPDWRTPTGETIAEAMDERGMRAEVLAHRSGIAVPTLLGILAGTVRITPGMAAGLSRVLGMSEQFILNREAAYRAPRTA